MCCLVRWLRLKISSWVRVSSFMDAEKFFGKKSSERGIADEPVVAPLEVEPSVLEVLDGLGLYFKSRLDAIEAKVDACLEK